MKLGFRVLIGFFCVLIEVSNQLQIGAQCRDMEAPPQTGL